MIMSSRPVAINGCVQQSPSHQTEDTDSQPAVVVTISDSHQPLLLEQQQTLHSSYYEGHVDSGEQADVADVPVVEAYRSDGNGDHDHISSTSSCGQPEKFIIMNGLPDGIVHEELTEISDVETNSLQNKMAEISDSSLHISAADKLDVSSLDMLHPVYRSSQCSLQDSTAVTLTDLASSSSDLLLQAGGSVADTMTHLSPKDCEAVHKPLLSNTECISAASLNVASMSWLRHDRHSVSSVISDTCASSTGLGARTGSDILPDVSVSHSSEKLWSWPNRRERIGFDSQAVGVVRSSWSQENYFDDSDVTCIDIDLDDDDLASSVDVLHYRDTSLSGDVQPYSWTEDDIRHGDGLCCGKLRSWAPLKGDEVFTELFSSDDESSGADNDYSSSTTHAAASDSRRTCAKTFGVGVAIDFDPTEDTSDIAMSSILSTNSHRLTNWNGLVSSASGSEDFDDLSDDIVNFPPSVFADIATRPSSKDVDRPSAARLAKRLYYLQGFRKSDRSRHLTKKYDTSCVMLHVIPSTVVIPQNAMLARYVPSSCVCLCLSQVCVLLKWLSVGSCKQCHTIAQRL